MAVNKRKILENARKLAQKGAKEKALLEYQKLLRLDSKDAKLRLEIGDSYRRWGQVDEAIDTYSRVADQYMKEGFDARAVAVFKQILNLDPDRYASYEPLAELYERMGLSGEAIQALQTAADGYHRQGKRREALGLLRKMATMDPTNTTSRLKVADLLRQEELNDEAVAEYEEVAAELERQGDTEEVVKVYERVLELAPERAGTQAGLARSLLACGDVAGAEARARAAVKHGAEEPNHYELLAEVHRAQNQNAKANEVYRSLADLYRERGDEDQAREILQRLVASDELSAGARGDALGAGEPKAGSAELFGEGFPETDPSSQPVAESQPFGDATLNEIALDDEPLEQMVLEDGPTIEAPPPSDDLVVPVTPSPFENVEETVSAPIVSDASPPQVGDLEQMIAEATVYLRYGKRERAIAQLQSVLDLDPDQLPALEKLGEMHAEEGESERALEFWMRAAKVARADGDSAALASLRDRIATLDESVAESLAVPDEAPQRESAASASQPMAADQEVFDELDLEIDLDETPLGGGSGEVPQPAQPAAAAEPGDISLSNSTTHHILEELEEADFYLQQGLLDEAEALYKRVLAVAPNHPRALVRLGEVAAARGDDPGASPSAAAHEASAQTTLTEADEELLEFEDETDELVESAPPSDAPIASSESESAPADEESAHDDGEELDLEIDDSDLIVPEAGDSLTELDIDPEPADSPALIQVSEAESSEDEEPDSGLEDALEVPDFDSAEMLPPVPEPQPSAPAVLDLGAAPSEGASSATAQADASADDSFGAVFDAFKKGVSQTLADGDHEAHYDLGIAYKEMGLLDDAMSEFRAAMSSPPRRMECLHLLALCAIDAGKPEIAIEHLEILMASSESTDAQKLAGRFEVGRAYESMDDPMRARIAFESVAGIDPNYCDVAERLEALGDAPLKEEVEQSQDPGETFDDLVAEANADTGADADEPRESFEDLIAEANDEGEHETGLASAPLEAEDEKSSPPAAPAKKPAPRKRKRISFV